MVEAVALLAEGVDRNYEGLPDCTRRKRSPSSRRAWIEMPSNPYGMRTFARSPSSRRAWIEISALSGGAYTTHVALLAEGVDRNQQSDDDPLQSVQSPSSRRAWIEMMKP